MEVVSAKRPGELLSGFSVLDFRMGRTDTIPCVSCREGLSFAEAAFVSAPACRLCDPVEVRMMEGTVKWFNDTKGYGFISPSDGSSDLFVHYSDIEGTGRRSLQEGDKVEFETGQGDKGPKAMDVRVLDE